MSRPRNTFIVRAFISTPKSVEYVWERTIDRVKLKKSDAIFTITTVDEDYLDNAAGRALAEIDRLHTDVNHHDVYRMGLARAAEILREELKRYHGE